MAGKNWIKKILDLFGTPILASLSADIAAAKVIVDDIYTVTDELPNAGALTDIAQEATLTAIKGGGWTDETLVTIMAAIASVAGIDVYVEVIPNIVFDLSAIDDILTADPPSADVENSVVDIDEVANKTFVLRSLVINTTSFGTAGTKLTYKLWTMVNNVVTMVDSTEVSVLGMQNLMDLFGLPEVYADGVWVTVQAEAGISDGACEGTYGYAQAGH